MSNTALPGFCDSWSRLGSQWSANPRMTAGASRVPLGQVRRHSVHPRAKKLSIPSAEPSGLHSRKHTVSGTEHVKTSNPCLRKSGGQSIRQPVWTPQKYQGYKSGGWGGRESRWKGTREALAPGQRGGSYANRPRGGLHCAQWPQEGSTGEFGVQES